VHLSSDAIRHWYQNRIVSGSVSFIILLEGITLALASLERAAGPEADDQAQLLCRHCTEDVMRNAQYDYPDGNTRQLGIQVSVLPGASSGTAEKQQQLSSSMTLRRSFLMSRNSPLFNAFWRLPPPSSILLLLAWTVLDHEDLKI
jgi:hypothetical protein